MIRAAVLLAMVVAVAACDGDPVPLADRVRPLLAGDTRLVGYGSNACSRGEPASGDGHRWCAFYRDTEGRAELWVADVTRALHGEAITCDGTSSACRLLTDKLFTGVKFETPSHPEGHRFEGDTLFFLAEAHAPAAALDRYEGKIFAWRPGWQQPRALTSERGVVCSGHPTAPVAYCVDGVSDEPRLELDLRAGRLGDRDGPLPTIERIVASRAGQVAWSVQLSTAGDRLAYSNVRDGEADETLRVVTLGDAGAARAVVTEGSAWQLSADGRSVYFLRSLARTTGGRAGTLWGADFPSGENAAAIAEGVYVFEAAGDRTTDRGVAFLTDLSGLEGTLHVVRDRRRPTDRLTLSRDVHFWRTSADGRHTFILRSTRTEETGHLASNETGAVCRLGPPDVTIFAVSFLPQLGRVAYRQPVPGDEERDEMVLAGDDCVPSGQLGAGVEYLLELGDGALLVGRKTADDDERVALSYERPLTATMPTPLVPLVDTDSVALIGARPEALLVGTVDDKFVPTGLHLVGPLPR